MVVSAAQLAEIRYAVDPVAWAEERLRLALDPWQREVLRSPSRRRVLRAGRQTGKTTVAAVDALHELIYRRRAFVIVLAPSLRQTTEFARTLAQLLDRLPDAEERVKERAKTQLLLRNGSRLLALTSNEATGRGFAGCTLLVEDEASRVPDELHAAIRPSLATTNGRCVLLSTPAGRAGHFYEAATDPTGVWHAWHAPSSSCPRIAPEFLAAERAQVGPAMYAREYAAEWAEADEALFPHDLLRAMLTDDVVPLMARPDPGAFDHCVSLLRGEMASA